MCCAFSPRVYLSRKWWALLIAGIALVCMVVNIAYGGDALPLALETVAFLVPLCRVGHRLIYRKNDYIELQPQCVIVYQLRDGWTMREYLRVEIHGVSDLQITPERITVTGACDAYLYRRGAAAASADAGEPDRFYALLRSRRSDLREIRKHEKGIRLWRLN